METSGLDHIDFSVTDLDRSYKFYRDVLGFDVGRYPADHPDPLFAGSCYFMVGGVEIGLIKHPETSETDRFDEMRIGLDHMAFKAPNEAALAALVEKLRAAGVETQGVEAYGTNGKKSVTFRDPDNIQLEYWLDKP